MGAGQFGVRAMEWYERFFHHPERMAEIFSHFCRLGFPGAHVVGYPTIVQAALITKRSHPLKVAVSLLPENWADNLQLVARLEPEVIFVHGAMTDSSLARRGEELLDCLQAIRDHGAFPGMATHNAHRTLIHLQNPANPLSQENFGLLLPINYTGWAMGGPLKETIRLLRKAEPHHPVMAMKVLAAGRLPPEKGPPIRLRDSQSQGCCNRNGGKGAG